MLEIELKGRSALAQLFSDKKSDFSIPAGSIEEKVKLLIIRDLFRRMGYAL